MDRNDYLKYISHFVEKVDPLATDTEYKEFFLKHLGKAMFTAPDAKIKVVAIHLYKAYLLGTIIKLSPLYLASTLTSEQLTSFIGEERKLMDKYKVEFPLHLDTVPSKMEAAMAKQSASSKKAVLDMFSTPKKEPAKRARAPAKKSVGAKAKKTPVRKAAPAKKPAAPKKTAGKQPVKKTVAKASAKAPAKSSAKASAAKASAKACKDHPVKELKDLAKIMKVPAYYKMTKPQLCAELGFK
jgi:hypothetical protein